MVKSNGNLGICKGYKDNGKENGNYHIVMGMTCIPIPYPSSIIHAQVAHGEATDPVPLPSVGAEGQLRSAGSGLGFLV